VNYSTYFNSYVSMDEGLAILREWFDVMLPSAVISAFNWQCSNCLCLLVNSLYWC